MISMKTPTFRNIDHSQRSIVGAVATTMVSDAGSAENTERLLEGIYKEICSKETQVVVNMPDMEAPDIHISQVEPNINNHIDIKQDPQTVNVTFSAHLGIVYFNIILSVLALSIAVYSLVK